MTLDLGLIIEAEALADYLDDECLLVVDVSIPQVYKEGHVPGAVHLAYPKIVFAHDDVDCDIPPDNVLGLALSEIGLLSDKHVVAYDSQNNPMASRLCWTLEEIGHEKFSLLNGGLNAWRDGGLAVEKKINTAAQSDYRVEQTGYCNATKEYILSKIGDPGVVILDTRMAEEFTNELLITDRGGNIPGAIHFDWMNNINQDDHFKLYGPDVLMANFRDIG
ncbi:MAG: rhodanese-like domain-containing protein, partial [Gammaproteobacteria bacterium]|nr:rhodanese-like domain-containing protein [Gammaproteobacteria bacterium]